MSLFRNLRNRCIGWII